MLAVEKAVREMPAAKAVPVTLEQLQPQLQPMVAPLLNLQRRLALVVIPKIFLLTSEPEWTNVMKESVSVVLIEKKPLHVKQPLRQMQRLPRVVTVNPLLLLVIVMPVAVGTMAPLAVTLTCPVVAGVLQY
jgi:hypothetical protein